VQADENRAALAIGNRRAIVKRRVFVALAGEDHAKSLALEFRAKLLR